MKKILYIFVFLFLTQGVKAQRYKSSSLMNYQKVDQKRLHFGFTLGLNSMDFAVYNSGLGVARAEQVIFSPGFTVGIVSELRLHEDWSLRFLPGLEFGQRTLSFSNLPQPTSQIESVLVNLPLLIKYRARRINNYRPYLVAGGSFKIDVQSQKKLNPDEQMFIRLNNTDVYYELGAGVDFYLPYFKFSTEFKFSIGLKDILNHVYDVDNPGYEEYTDVIRRMNSKIITLSFHFE